MSSEKIFKYVLVSSGAFMVLIALGIAAKLFVGSIPSFKGFVLDFFCSAEWNPSEGRESYGALPFIVGTLLTSILAFIITLPFAFDYSILMYLGELVEYGKAKQMFKTPENKRAEEYLTGKFG